MKTEVDFVFECMDGSSWSASAVVSHVPQSGDLVTVDQNSFRSDNIGQVQLGQYEVRRRRFGNLGRWPDGSIRLAVELQEVEDA